MTAYADYVNRENYLEISTILRQTEELDDELLVQRNI